jgi:hypothetical protein
MGLPVVAGSALLTSPNVFLHKSQVGEALLKRKAQYSWSPFY